MKCVVYRSVKKDGYYLYLEFGKKLSDVPGARGTASEIRLS